MVEATCYRCKHRQIERLIRSVFDKDKPTEREWVSWTCAKCREANVVKPGQAGYSLLANAADPVFSDLPKRDV